MGGRLIDLWADLLDNGPVEVKLALRPCWACWAAGMEQPDVLEHEPAN
jgi:hypothetical protein